MDLDYGYHFKEDQFLNDYDQVSLFLDKSWNQGHFQEGHTAPSTLNVPSSPSTSVFSIQDFPGETGFEVGLAHTPQQHSAPLQVVSTTITLPMTLEAELEICSLRSPPNLKEEQRNPTQVEQPLVFEVVTAPPPPQPAPVSSEPAQDDIQKLTSSTSTVESIGSPLSDQTPFTSPSPSAYSDCSPKSSPRRPDYPKDKKEQHLKKKLKVDKSPEKQDPKDKEDKDHGKNHVKLQRGGKNRLKWTPELIELFHKAVKKLGSGAVPSAILEEMNVKGLTRENVASHLQKYRLQNKKLPRKESADDILYPEEKEQMKNMVALDYMGHVIHTRHPGHPYGFHPESPFIHPMLHPGSHHPHPPHHPGMYHGPPMPHHLQRRFSVPTHIMSHPPPPPIGSPHSPPQGHHTHSHSLPPSPLPQPQSPPPSSQQHGGPGGSPQRHHPYVCYSCTRRFSLPGHTEDLSRGGYPAPPPPRAPSPKQFDS